MTTQHTPGPLLLKAGHHIDVMYEVDGRLEPVATFHTLSLPRTRGEQRDQAIANARLFLASEKLLMELERMVDHFTLSVAAVPGSFGASLITDARAAIAKALGTEVLA